MLQIGLVHPTHVLEIKSDRIRAAKLFKEIEVITTKRQRPRVVENNVLEALEYNNLNVESVICFEKAKDKRNSNDYVTLVIGVHLLAEKVKYLCEKESLKCRTGPRLRSIYRPAESRSMYVVSLGNEQ